MTENSAAPGRRLDPRESLRGEPDPYAELLSGTHHAAPDLRQAREAWFAELELENKQEVLFELEVLLKGIACFANPRNHPGPPRRTPVVATDFSWHLAYLRDAVARIVNLSKQLVGDRAGARLARRYLATALPGDPARSLLTSDLARNTPDESLLALRHALLHALAVVDGTLRLQRVPFRLFYAHASLMRREIAHNGHFNPVSALEFQPEFDGLESDEVLAVVGTVPGQASRRLAAVTFLSLFRMARYARLVDTTVKQASADKRHRAGAVYLVLAVLRSDARALCNHLQKRASALLAASFEDEIFWARAVEIRTRVEVLSARGSSLLAAKSALDTVSAGVALEMRRMFERELPAPDAVMADDELLARLESAARELVPALDKLVVFLAKALGSELAASEILPGRLITRQTSERERRDVWSLAQIHRAFVSKAGHVRVLEDAWAATDNHAFVREFVSYFQALGLPLLRVRGFARLDAMVAVLDELRDADLVDAPRMARAKHEAQQAEAFLVQVFDQMSEGDELRGVPFDRRRAAEALRAYLDH